MPAPVTFVIPVLNERAVIADVLEDLCRDVLDRLPGAEAIVVDDGSTDGTDAVVGELARRHPAVRLIRTGRTLGQGPATVAGFSAADAPWLCHIDGDGQVVPAEFWKLWEAREQADLVIGVRAGRQDPAFRLLIARSVRGLMRVLAQRPLADAAAPFRLLRREVWEDVRPLTGDRALTFSILVSLAAARRGWRVVELPVSHRPRAHGRSRLHGPGLAWFCLRGAGEVALLHLRLRGPRS
jgi:dolichol-phosphate mannosyltransferase